MQEIIPKVSIIVPVYKVERYLGKCIDSILAQTLKEFELILIDDGSPDNSPIICDEYGKKDTRIKVIHQKNAGVSAARNTGLDIARGEFIGFVDSDDWIEPNTYEIAYNTALEKNADIVQWDFVFDYSSGKSIEKKFGVDGFFELAKDSSYFYGGMWHKLVAKRVIDSENIRFPLGLKYAEDRCFGIDCFLVAKNAYHIAKVLYHYCVNEESASFSITKETIIKDIDFVREKEEKINEKGGGEGWKYLLYDIKRSAKLRCLLNLKVPDFDLARSIYPEIDKVMLSKFNKYSIFYFFVYYHCDFFANVLIKILKKVNNKRY